MNIGRLNFAIIFPVSKVIVVTGASSGIGHATVSALLEKKWTVYATARDISKLTDLKDLGAQTLELDVSDESSIKKAISEIVKKEKKIDVLVNNAGFGSYGAVEDSSIEEVKKQFDVNLFSIGRILKVVLPFMRERKSGTIINISSMGGKIYTPLGAWYHATKHAVEGFSDCLRIELAPYGIKVVIVEPGVIKTNFYSRAMKDMEKSQVTGAYRKMTDVMTENFKKSGETGADPSVVAKSIVKAIESDNPRTRYAVPGDAKMNIFLRKILPDKLFDKVLIKITNFPTKV